jgi:hypothetical protein
MQELLQKTGFDFIALPKPKCHSNSFAIYTSDLVEKDLYLEVGQSGILIGGKKPSSLTYITACSAKGVRAYYGCVALVEEPVDEDFIIGKVKDIIGKVSTWKKKYVLQRLEKEVIDQQNGKRNGNLFGKTSKRVHALGVAEFKQVMSGIKDKLLSAA